MLPQIEANQYFDDRLADTLDTLFGYGIGDLDMLVTGNMIDVFQIESQACHNDTTSVSMYGDADNNKTEKGIQVTFGHSKKHRRDLKQFVWSMSVSSDHAFPLFQKAYSGNTVDEIIFRTDSARNRLMLELMARSGMRVGEVLKLTPNDILDRKLILNDTKSCKEQELIFIPQKVADRLKEYVRVQQIAPKQKIFPICYGAARAMVKNAGQLVGICLRTHDLRRHSATFASRSNVPLEIISKVILRHSSLQTIKSFNYLPSKL